MAAEAPARHWFGPAGPTSLGEGHPVLFGFSQAEDFGPFPEGGGYPKGFLERAYPLLGVTDPSRVLHLCSGSMSVGIRVDVREERRPSVVADCRRTPFRNGSFDWIMADPPYSEAYARNLYGTEARYPKPGQILREAARLLRPSGRLGLLHFQVPMVQRPLSLVRVVGITTGTGYAIRAFSVMEKDADGFWSEAEKAGSAS